MMQKKNSTIQSTTKTDTRNKVIVLNDQGGSVMSISDLPSTLRAESHQHEPVICYAIEGNVVDRVSSKNGKGWCEDVSPTLNTQDRHAVVYTIDAMSSNSMKSSNPHSGIHETQVAKCLDTACLDPSCNQGGHMVCYRKTVHPHNPNEGQGYEETTVSDTLNGFDNNESRTPVIVLEGHGSRPSHMGNGYSESDTMYTLNTIEQHSVCYPVCYQKTVGALCADDWRMINKQYIDQNKVVCYENIQP